MHIFLSDAHIRKDDSLRAQLLVKFLNEIKGELKNLFIVGDLFEFWFEYNVVIPKDYFKILATFYNLHLSGVGLHYILGNHEVLIGDFLKNLGFVLYPDDARIELDGKKIYLAHGNRIDRRIWTLFWENLLNSKINHALYSLLHPDIGVFLAQGVAHLSRQQPRNLNLSIMLERFALEKLNEFDIVILAHSHIPVFKNLKNGKYYINTGDWVDNFSYVKLKDGIVSLNYYR
ncbi:MAG: UDP-2,3-diacylglucosamine diphosphatase [candidate division WOR-3 bacterium]|nr:UDP-2,3-diacylglucosamine diphosphatase [candidate division WOR-3 bacterium]